MANRWIVGARPKTLPAVVSPVLLGVCFGAKDKSHLNWINLLLVFIIGLGLQIAVNYANDYSDGIKGSDANRVGPVRLVASGLASAKAVKNAALITIAISAIAGLIFASRTSYWFLLIGIAAIWATWGYTGGKNPYGYKGFGEISVFIFFGLVATIGAYYGQAFHFNLNIFWAACGMGSFSCAILMANNIRDLPTDQVVGKKTLAVRLGDSWARRLNIAFLLMPFLFLVLFGIQKPVLLIAYILLPLTYPLIKIIVSKSVGPQLIKLLANTSRLQLIYATLLSLLYFIN